MYDKSSKYSHFYDLLGRTLGWPEVSRKTMQSCTYNTASTGHSLERTTFSIVLLVCSVCWLFLLGCRSQCKWLTGKTRFRN